MTTVGMRNHVPGGTVAMRNHVPGDMAAMRNHVPGDMHQLLDASIISQLRVVAVVVAIVVVDSRI